MTATVARGKAVANALAAAEATAKWTSLPAEQRRLSGITAAELATPGEEAQAIALALREVVEMPGRTAALVTPDRGAGAARGGTLQAVGTSPWTIRRGGPCRSCRRGRC